VDKAGKYATASLEYEAIWSMGGMTGIDDLDTIARLDYLCDDIGLDTMSTGVAIAVAMDAGHKKFGDRQAAIEMVEEIGNDTEFGRILGNGSTAGIVVALPDGARVRDLLTHLEIPKSREAIVSMDARIMKPDDVLESGASVRFFQAVY
jgi:aldehyde:ferredoxin oxidoreductase